MGLIELKVGLGIHVSCHFIPYHIQLRVGLIELGMGLIELRISLKIN